MKHYSDDGRRSLEDLYGAYFALEKRGWIKEDVIVSKCEDLQLPILSFRTEKKGKAIWVLSGIHGEEPAGPNAIAEAIEDIRKLGEEYAVVLMPLCNPLGYARNWRYLNMREWKKDEEGFSVGDSDHLLPDLKNLTQPRRSVPSSPEAEALTRHVLKLTQDYPPLVTIDFHEDDLLDEGYVYSQGDNGIAKKIVGILSSMGISIKMDGKTRFDETVADGIVAAEKDGSIDEFLFSREIIVGGKPVKGPSAGVTIVVETPAAALPLEKRKAAHLGVLKNLKAMLPAAAT